MRAAYSMNTSEAVQETESRVSCVMALSDRIENAAPATHVYAGSDVPVVIERKGGADITR